MSRTASFTSCPGKLTRLGILTGSLLIGLAQTATAQNNCLQDEYGKNTQCTANDVRIASASNVRDPQTGLPITSCTSGGTFNFIADFKVVTTATARQNIGLYFGTGGQGNALKGACSDNIISPLHPDSAFPGGPQLGTAQYLESDSGTDTCGDITTADNNQIITVLVENALCKAAAGSNQVALPNCTSWQQPGGTLLCSSPSPSYPWVPAAIPGSPSKCNCDNTFTIPVTVQSPSINVAKGCTTANNPGPVDFTNLSAPNPSSCTLTEGGQVVYTVDMVNDKSNFGSVVVDQVCDTAYGTVYQVTGFTGPACAPGSVTGGSISSTTCTSTTIPFNSNATCTFTVNQPENSTVKDTVSVSGHGSSAGSFGPTSSNQVQVVSSEAATTGTIAKTMSGNTAGCATVRYNVVVTNTSATGSDETLSLSAFNDNAFGDITKVQGGVVGTTCGVAVGSAGLGSLSGVTASSTNGGALPTTIPVNGGAYSCQFDGQFCSALDSNGCFTHSNTISATLTGDENEVVSLTPGSLNIKECFMTPTTF